MQEDERWSGALDVIADLETVRQERGHSALRLAFDRTVTPLDHSEVAPSEVQQGRHALAVLLERIHPADEQVVVPGGEGLDGRALERRDRAVDQRQAGRAAMPRGSAKDLAAGADRRVG